MVRILNSNESFAMVICRHRSRFLLLREGFICGLRCLDLVRAKVSKSLGLWFFRRFEVQSISESVGYRLSCIPGHWWNERTLVEITFTHYFYFI